MKMRGVPPEISLHSPTPDRLPSRFASGFGVLSSCGLKGHSLKIPSAIVVNELRLIPPVSEVNQK